MARSNASWRRLRVSEMVTSSGATRKARGWTAGEGGIDRYVGLEHLDANSPTIRRWGTPETVGENSDLRPFEPGDVILARRGIEQRKVGVADFRGVASGHALVFRARPEVVMPEFLPHFLLSDIFMDRAVEFSAGSLSKTVNLSALMTQEFALPPLEEQRRIVPLLQALDSVVTATRDAAERAAVMREATSARLCTLAGHDGTLSLALTGFEGPWRKARLGDVIRLSRTIVRVEPTRTYREIGVRSFGRGTFLKQPVRGADLGSKRVFWIEPNRLVVNIVFAWEAAIAITGEECAGLIASHRFPTYEPIANRVELPFLHRYLLSPEGVRKLGSASPGGAGRNRTLGQAAFADIEIPLPPIEKQREIADRLTVIERAGQACEARRVAAGKLYRLAIREALDPSVTGAR